MSLYDLLLMPLRGWRDTLRMQDQLRRDFPTGGRCQICGEHTAPDERECSCCALAAPL
jgi:hypothetical protein